MDEAREREVAVMAKAADRLDSLAETAELMGDDAGSASLRGRALVIRMRAMDLLDER